MRSYGQRWDVRKDRSRMADGARVRRPGEATHRTAHDLHPALHRGGGQSDQAADRRVTGPGVLDQGRHDPFVDLVQAHGRQPWGQESGAAGSTRGTWESMRIA